MFFDDHPEFLATSSTANDRRRLNLRHLAIIEQNQDILQGARVLDIASHDGRWTYAALDAGAAHVTGVEGRNYLVENAKRTLAQKAIASDRFDFVVGDVHEVLTRGVGEFDVVMCLGFLYHTLRYPELFSGISRTGAQHIILDTAVILGRFPFLSRFPRVGKVPLVTLTTNRFKKESAAVADRYSYGDRTVVGVPSVAAIEHLLNSYGYKLTGRTDWKAIIREHPESKKEVRPYAKGSRVTLRAAKMGSGQPTTQ